jgi:predicted exporter
VTDLPGGAPRAGAMVQSPRRRAAAIALWFIAMVVAALVIARSPFSADLSAFLPASPEPAQRVLIDQLHTGVAARTLMIGIEGGDPAARAEGSSRLAAAMRASGLFEQVHNGELAGWQAAGEWIVRHRYQLSPAVDERRFTTEGLREAINDTLSLLGTPAGAAVKPLLESDPTGETQRIAETLLPADAPKSEQGVWVSRRAPRAVLMAQGRAAGADLDAQATLIRRVQSEFEALKSTPALQGLTLKMSGPPVFATDSRERIETEVKQLAVAGTVVIGLMLLLAFGSLPALAVAFVPVVSGIAAGIAAVALTFGSVHGMTLGFGSTLIGESVDYAIYYLIQARGAAIAGTGWHVWLRASWPTVRLGLLTSVCGFAALVMSGFPGLAQLGVFSIAGLAGAALATRWVLPALRPDGAAGQGLRRWMGRQAGRGIAALQRGRLVLWTLAGVAAALLAGAGATRASLWQGDLTALSPVSAAALALDADLRADLSASDARTLVVVGGATADQALQAAEQAGAKLEALLADGRIAGYDSPARWLPSQAMQRTRLAALPDAETLNVRLAEATAGGPLPARRLQPFVAQVQAARAQAPVEPTALAGTPLAPLVDALLFHRSGEGGEHWTALLPLQPGPKAIDPAALRQALAGVPGLQVVDIGQELASLYQRYLHEALWQSLLGALGVVVLLALALRSARRLWAVCLPLALAVLLTLTGLVLAGVPLGILHLVGLLLVVAVGSNYALFFDQLAQGGPADEDTLASLVLANLTTVVSFSLIGLSQIPALAAIGQVVAPGALLALVLSAAGTGSRGRGAVASP